MDKLKIKLKGLDCPNCSAKIENTLMKTKGVRECSINLMKQEMALSCEEGISEMLKEKIPQIVHKFEPDVEVSFGEDRKEHNHEHHHEEEVCGCAHEHHHHEREACTCDEECYHHEAKTGAELSGNTLKIQMKGLTCSNCAAKIENDTRKLEGVEDVSISLMKQAMEIRLSAAGDKNKLFTEVKNIAGKYEPDVLVAWADEEKKAAASEEETEEEFDLKGRIIKYTIGVLLFLGAELLPLEQTLQTGLFLASYLIFGFGVLKNAVKNISRGQVFDENFLMGLSTVGAIAIGELAEAVFVMLFYQVGETFQEFAVHRSRRSIKDLMDIRPDYANVERKGSVLQTAPEEVHLGDVIVVKPGEKVPLDGIIIEGESQLDTSALTGESVPRKAREKDEVLSGSINLNGLLRVRVTKEFGESTAVKILELVENATAKKSKTEQFITKFARVYTPCVVIAAVLLAFLPPIAMGSFDFRMWIGRALIFLVISCPCALVLSVPLGFFSGIGEASRKGILVKGSNYIQVLHEIETIVFDKTGTVTMGVFEVSDVKEAEGFSRDELVYLTALSEKMSNHPIAKSIAAFYEAEYGGLPEDKMNAYEEISGHGVKAEIDGSIVLAGNEKLMKKYHVSYEKFDGFGSVVYVAKDGKYAGYIVVSDKIKEGSKEAVQRLKGLGVKNVVMLTGDNRETADKIGREVLVDTVYAELLPQEKVEKMEGLFENSGKVAFVGDGINDAPSLARADVGIAMGGIGSDAAIEAADVVIMNDDLRKIADGVVIARNTNRIVVQNIVFALGVKAVVLVMGALGYASMWMAVFADVGVAFIAILNSMRKKI